MLGVISRQDWRLLSLWSTSAHVSVAHDFEYRMTDLLIPFVVTVYVLYMIKREWGNYVDRRQEFLTSRYWATKAQSRTVLVTGIPDDYINHEALHSMTDFLPGGVRKIWLAKNPKELADIYDRNIKAAKKLESANLSQIKLANKLVRKKKVDPSGNEDYVKGHQERVGLRSNDNDEQIVEVEFARAARYIPPKKVPTHRLGPIPFYGKKVDSIPWAMKEVETTNRLLAEKRQDLSKYPPKSAAFILFNDQIGAHIFAQCLAHDLPLRMSQRYINVSPKDVIWFTLNINPYSARVRFAAGWAATAAICLFWSFPTAFVTSISNVTAICDAVSWLNWLCELKAPLNVSTLIFTAQSRRQTFFVDMIVCFSLFRVSFKVFFLL